MAVIIMPSVPFFPKRNWRLNQPSQMNRSGWTGATKIVRLPGADQFFCSVQLKPMKTENEVLPWRAFFAALQGQGNTFDMPAACQPVGATVGNVAAGAVSAAIGGGLVKGHYITLSLASGRKQMAVLTSDAGAFQPIAREAATGNIGHNPYCRMRLMSADVGWSEEDGVFNIAFDCEEAT